MTYSMIDLRPTRTQRSFAACSGLTGRRYESASWLSTYFVCNNVKIHEVCGKRLIHLGRIPFMMQAAQSLVDPSRRSSSAASVMGRESGRYDSAFVIGTETYHFPVSRPHQHVTSVLHRLGWTAAPHTRTKFGYAIPCCGL